MNPELGNAATSAPKAAFFRSTPRDASLRRQVAATVKNTISSALTT